MRHGSGAFPIGRVGCPVWSAVCEEQLSDCAVRKLRQGLIGKYPGGREYGCLTSASTGRNSRRRLHSRTVRLTSRCLNIPLCRTLAPEVGRNLNGRRRSRLSERLPSDFSRWLGYGPENRIGLPRWRCG